MPKSNKVNHLFNEIINLIQKYIVFSFLLTLLFTGCTTTTKNVQTPLTATNEVSNKELFENKENWQPINKDQTLQNIKNEKVVR